MTVSDRADAKKNRTLLLDAAGRMLAEHGRVTVNDVAAEAGISRATAYRHFSTADDLVTAYIDRFLAHFEANIESAQSLTQLSEQWCVLVEEHAPALVHVRSTEGFLTRAANNDPIISRIDRLVRETLERDPRIDSRRAGTTDLAVFFWNALLDPRELLDLANHLGVPLRDLATIASEATYAAVTAAIAARPGATTSGIRR